MSSPPRRRYRAFIFDPVATAEFSKRILERAAITGALIGTVRTWDVLPTDEQLETKDMDFAVRQEDNVWIEKLLNEMHIPFGYCEIGGLSVVLPEQGIKVDFVDRRVEWAALFREAIEAAQAEKEVSLIGSVELLAAPVEYVIAMKLATARPKDDLIIDMLLRSADFDYDRVRDIVCRHLGIASVYRLDAMALRAGRVVSPRLTGPCRT
jgi:hypothetical protein